ncbi:MAG TPA: UTP--glucose-1-phosphate uridylyltransferase [Methanophagales archaeon]|nr:UTP--glucose-1-phosphate uridylyltransferase [Methanophagales archaeon]
MITKAVIPAAGLGTRFLPATKAQPKEMLPVVDKPVIQYVVEEAIASGIKDILIITGKGKRAIEDHFDKSEEENEFLDEIDEMMNHVNLLYTKISSYGIIKGKEVEGDIYLVEDLVEKPSVEEAPSNLGILGRYVLTPAIFGAIEGTPPGKGGEIQLTDAVRLVREKIYAYVYRGRRYDIGNKLDWIKSNIELSLRDERFNNELENFLRTLI